MSLRADLYDWVNASSWLDRYFTC